jgi:hypothetical protein
VCFANLHPSLIFMREAGAYPNVPMFHFANKH